MQEIKSLRLRISIGKDPKKENVTSSLVKNYNKSQLKAGSPLTYGAVQVTAFHTTTSC